LFYDIHPQFFILPCISLDEAKDWTPGHEYEVVLICSNEVTARKMIGNKAFWAHREGRVVSEAREGDLVHARTLLTATIKALAESATRQDCVRPSDLISSEENTELMNKLLGDHDDGNVLVPGPHLTKFNVLKVKLGNSFDYEVPDPMLLAMKAAINWYFIMTKLKLLPACEPPEDPLEKEISIANEELCEDLREHDLRLEAWEDLAKGLGQLMTPDNRSLSPTGDQKTPVTEECDLESTNEELSPHQLYVLYDEIGGGSDYD
jgi:hypothetical protein